ncbi:hypothetical protein DMENIID0001_103560 [Sergentomyia squamirostris]
MKKSVKNKSISEEISSLFTRKAVAESDSDDNEVNLAESAEIEDGNEVSEIHKRNAPRLDEISSRYKGVPSSRDLDSDSSDEEQDLQDDSEEEDLDDEEESGEEISEKENDEESSSSVQEESPAATESIKLVSQKLSEEASKGFCVKNQLRMWENLMEIRIRSQSMMTLANRLPFVEIFRECEDSSPEFTALATEVQENITGVLNNLIETQNLLVNSHPDTKTNLPEGLFRKMDFEDSPEGPRKKRRLEYSSKTTNDSFRKLYRSTIDKWSEKVIQGKGKEKISSTSGSILSEIDKKLAERENLIRKSQICRGNYELFHESQGEIDEDSGRKISGEIYDDTDFYHEILSELIEAKSMGNLDSVAAAAVQRKSHNSTKKVVDTKASKGRRIRYVVHKKMVNFMAPNPYTSWSEEAKDELFSSIFGAGHSN